MDQDDDGSADGGPSLTPGQAMADAADLQASLADLAGLVTGSLGLEELLGRVASFAARAIPVIDVGPAFRGEPCGLDGVAAEVRRASEQVGFFYIAGHGVPQAIIDGAFAASREFHAMPAAEKQALRINENNIVPALL